MQRFFIHISIFICYMASLLTGAEVDPSQTLTASHPFSVHDMLAMDRISDPQASPDGKTVVFVVRKTDLKANRGRTDLWLVHTDGSGLRCLTSHPENDSNPRWAPDSRTVWFLSSRLGSSQVWKIRIDGGEARKVTRLLDLSTMVSPVWGFRPFRGHLNFT